MTKDTIKIMEEAASQIVCQFTEEEVRYLLEGKIYDEFENEFGHINDPDALRRVLSLSLGEPVGRH